MILLRRDRALRVKEHPMTTKRVIIISIKDNEGSIVVLANVYVESGDEERRNDVWKEVTREITKIKKNSKKCRVIVAGDWNACTEHDSVFREAGKTRKIDVEMKQHLMSLEVEDKISEYRKKIGGTNEQFATREDREGNLQNRPYLGIPRDEG